MDENKGIAWVKFHSRRVDEWKRLSKQALEIVRTRDSGTLQHEIFFDEGESEADVFEGYRDAAIEHFSNISHLMEPIKATASVTGEVLGTPNPKMKEQLGKMKTAAAMRTGVLLTFIMLLGQSAHAAQMADGGGKAPMSACVRVVDETQSIPTGDPRVQQFVTRTVTLKNVCRSRAYNVTLDVTIAPDPPCHRIDPGKTTKFQWQSSTNFPALFRSIKQCD
jgi:hypothetical protein